ncbi:DnaJ domain-containing protein [Rhodoligotrophos defluvii]|uniref:DnaJ domain-containing protein n=1 Tax=Rhodoligotrophos defluvii TaxID=2561934 RepID=UPI0010CA111E|nr:DnaJ domain-containing protein [Rhodoligotrophos defluvii]
MQAFLLVALALLLAYWLLRKSVKADPKRLAKMTRLGGGAAIALVGLIMSLRGGMALGAPLMAFGLGLLGREMNIGAPGGFSRAGGRSAGQRSGVRTTLLDMELDHDTGTMDGSVLMGRHAGRRLSSMSLAELLDLRSEAQGIADQSRLLLDAYLDRMHAGWRNGAGGASARANGAGDPRRGFAMSRAEACRILEVSDNASEREIRAAHRRLMKKFHPDAGGSDAFAALINQAKDVLLRR